jgi:hypothetical protein
MRVLITSVELDVAAAVVYMSALGVCRYAAELLCHSCLCRTNTAAAVAARIFFRGCIGRTVEKIKKQRMKRMHQAHGKTESIYVIYEKTSF